MGSRKDSPSSPARARPEGYRLPQTQLEEKRLERGFEIKDTRASSQSPSPLGKASPGASSQPASGRHIRSDRLLVRLSILDGLCCVTVGLS